MYERTETFQEELGRAKDAFRAASGENQAAAQAWSFFKLILRGPVVMEIFIDDMLTQWDTLPLSTQVVLAKLAGVFEKQGADVMALGGPLLLHFQKEAHKVPEGLEATETFKASLENYLAWSHRVEAVMNAIRTRQRNTAKQIMDRPDVAARLKDAHDHGKREIAEGLGQHTSEDFWASLTES